MSKHNCNSISNETKWTDDSIRWSEEEQRQSTPHRTQEEEEEDESNACCIDIFKDPDPHESFQFHFELNNSIDGDNVNVNDEEPSLSPSEDVIDIELNGYKYSSDEIWQSTGLTLWKASEHLCHYLVKHRHDEEMNLCNNDNNNNNNDKRRILELGAGLGLVGILAHRISSPQSHVYLTDGDTEALVYLRENVESNKSKDGTTGGDISCNQLLWGRQTSLDFLEQHGEKFNVILASDIVYSPVIIEPLWETIQCLLDTHGVFVFAYARRKVPVSIDDVLEASKKAGFRYEKCVETDEEKGIYIYKFRWKN